MIVDAFTDLAVALEEAAASAPGGTNRDAIFAATLRYRTWALERPVEFQLIYGNPIPGYVAPFEVTAPLAGRPFAALGRYFLAAWQSGELTLPVTEADIPESVGRHMETWRREMGLDALVEPLYAVIAGWTRIHGLVTLELFHHLQPVIGDTEALYRRGQHLPRSTWPSQRLNFHGRTQPLALVLSLVAEIFWRQGSLRP